MEGLRCACGAGMDGAFAERAWGKVRLLRGDVFVRYSCGRCSAAGVPVLERQALSWLQLVHLALYHLTAAQAASPRRPGRPPAPVRRVSSFGVSEVAALLDEAWPSLCPGQAQHAALADAVRAVLAAHPTLFLGGDDDRWALREVLPPRRLESERYAPLFPDRDALRQSALSSAVLSGMGSLAEIGLAGLAPQVSVSHALPSGGAAPGPVSATTVRAAAEIKRKLVERLLRLDAKLLREALAAQPSPPPTASDLSDRPALHAIPGRALAPPMRSATPRASNFVRASPHENDLLEAVLRLSQSSSDPALLRLGRKLLVRRMRRRHGGRVFDVDAVLYGYLRSSDPLVWQPPGSEAAVAPEADDSSIWLREDMTLRARMLGPTHAPDYPSFLISPIDGAILPGVVHCATRPCPMLNLLSELRAVFSKKGLGRRSPCPAADTCRGAGSGASHGAGDQPQNSQLRHANRPTGQLSADSSKSRDQTAAPTANAIDASLVDRTIVFLHLRPEWVRPVDDLLLDCGLDLGCASFLAAPDYALVAAHGRLPVAVALVDASGTLRAMAVRRGWRRAGLGSLLLLLAVERASPRGDIVLRCSAQASSFFARFAFKVEAVGDSFLQMRMSR